MNSNVWICAQQPGREAAVAVAEDEGVVAVGEAREEGGSAQAEKRPEAAPFHPAVHIGKAVEVGRGIGRCLLYTSELSIGKEILRCRATARPRWRTPHTLPYVRQLPRSLRRRVRHRLTPSLLQERRDEW